MNIFYPHSVIIDPNAADEEIGWVTIPSTTLNSLLNQRWKTVTELKHISNPATGDIQSYTKALICTDFGIAGINEINGIELLIVGQRNGRIADEIVQLYNTTPIGDNKFNHITDYDGHLLITNETPYGGVSDMWNTTLTPADIQQPNFGVILKFQSHPYYPHSCGMIIESVSLTIY